MTLEELRKASWDVFEYSDDSMLSVIRLVLEEAANVALDKGEAVSVSKYATPSAPHSAKSMAIVIASAIRALGEK